ncbi:hypothetical protein AMAG_01385 [Allomyces macrogynus ATCC 38327]|uniref:Uncharacterized protein n=1 Tax=Allomyces macrogynus (strain ATCC 38327) TaxID=578462 RepID=A0A0L0RYQ0_ALLM3|nr:hypothetical protein AMAG_01385 [Allomyces macrogynus ATCC 38327]|eukprot:KNE55497.1 hypothetical protein AMAG_01385 [Allomyces macrogynus ATCC 38327]
MYKPNVIDSLVRAALGSSARNVADHDLDAYIAQLIAKEATDKRKKYQAAGIAAAYLPAAAAAPASVPESRALRPNVGFLKNVMRQTSGHNAAVARAAAAAAAASSSHNPDDDGDDDETVRNCERESTHECNRDHRDDTSRDRDEASRDRAARGGLPQGRRRIRSASPHTSSSSVPRATRRSKRSRSRSPSKDRTDLDDDGDERRHRRHRDRRRHHDSSDDDDEETASRRRRRGAAPTSSSSSSSDARRTRRERERERSPPGSSSRHGNDDTRSDRERPSSSSSSRRAHHPADARSAILRHLSPSLSPTPYQLSPSRRARN